MQNNTRRVGIGEIISILDDPLLSVVLAFILLIALLYFNILAFTLTDILSYMALVIGIATVLYTRKSMLLEVRIRHTNDLHKFLEKWLEELTSYNQNIIENLPTLNTPFIKKHEYSQRYGLYKIVDNGLYRDLLDNHIPKEHANFIANWMKYKTLLENYESACFTVWGMIVDDIEERNLGIALSDKFEQDRSIINTNYVRFVYTKFLNKLLDINHIRNLSLSIKPYSLNERTFYQLFAHSDEGDFTLANGSQNEMKKVEKMFNEDFYNSYEKYSKELRKGGWTADNMELIRKGWRDSILYSGKCYRTLRELVNYPVLSGTNCNILRKI
jgi:hypothetical protein